MYGIMKIYSLADPVTSEVRYIGTTSGPLNVRLSQHKWDSKNKMSYKSHWSKQVFSSKKKVVEFLGFTLWNNPSQYENYLITYKKI